MTSASLAERAKHIANCAYALSKDLEAIPVAACFFCCVCRKVGLPSRATGGGFVPGRGWFWTHQDCGYIAIVCGLGCRRVIDTELSPIPRWYGWPAETLTQPQESSEE